jgi:hypothetical protein
MLELFPKKKYRSQSTTYPFSTRLEYPKPNLSTSNLVPLSQHSTEPLDIVLGGTIVALLNDSDVFQKQGELPIMPFQQDRSADHHLLSISSFL